ncbi:MAG: hypothetical protein JNJ73_20590 [Hyphomonadaceae bacterium]|nr:hypothetical protein [Hyphomonadaceae bacterium]
MIEQAMRRAVAAAILATTLISGQGVARAQPAAEAADTARTMDMTFIAVPVVRHGRLINYLFVSMRVEVANGVDLWRTRERAHFLRDALVRAAHQNDLADAARDDQLDRPRAMAVFRAAAAEALGARAVGGLNILDVRPARPMQMASRSAG